jgi:thiol:disulfide interchange protein DsbD
VKRLGLIYAVGVLASFMALATMVILVQRAGQNASWGMQMQNPYFRLALTVIVFLVALNLFGVFEVSLGGRALDTAAQLSARQGGAGAFFNGILATVLATPCTAPFLAVALGFAFTQPAWVVVLIFASTGMGLASLYVALSWNPTWLKLLPRPGAWMGRFKTIMGFPMLATMIWLLDLTHESFGEGGLLWLSLFLLLLGLAAWVYGEFLQRNRQRRILASAMVAALLGFAYFYLLEGQLHWRSPQKQPTTGSTQLAGAGITWQPWSPEAVAQARAQGRPVLVDFTAKWCLTCKANKRLAIEVPKVAERLSQMNAVTLRADNTDPNEAIAGELRHFGRAGVPLVLIYPKDAGKPPLVLPTLLTESTVLQALKEAAP